MSQQDPKPAGRSLGLTALFPVLGVGGMLGLLFAAHELPGHGGALQAAAVGYFIGMGLLKVALDFRRGR